MDFESVYQEHFQAVYRFLLSLCRNHALAEELTQETFFRAYMNYSGLRDKDKASVWLCQIAKNAYFRWYNEQKKRGALPENADGDAQSLEEAFERRELSGKALACLHALEEPYKEVFMLSVFGGFSLKDVSAIFGKSESWARVTFYRARQKLMERMNQHGL